MAPGTPASTYRLQLTPEFGFAEAAEAADYLTDLGVTHAYLSPVLDAVPGSQHGYDVTDHARIRSELGGEDGFRALAKRLHARGLGIVLDIVPNHMAVPTDMSLNRQLWSVLRDGRDSPYATWFDIDWAAQDDRMLLPVLGGPVESCLEDLWVEASGGPDGEPVLRYFDHVLPLWPGTSRLPMRGLLESQHYRLAWWRDAATDLNYRRFFDITTLIGIRVEDPAVFDATHEVILGLVAEGLIDGLRVDHPDGLADPRGYLRRLSAAANGAWVVAEKILEADEVLPADWACAGTTGYDALRVADGLFLDPAGADALSSEYTRFCRQSGDDCPAAGFAEVAAQAKREIANGSLAAEVTRLTRLLGALSPDASTDDLRTVLTEVLAAFPVYRAYVYPGEFAAKAAEAEIKEAVDEARRQLPRRLRGLAGYLGAAALGVRPPVSGAAGRAGEFVVRFQQTTGPVEAKGVEDTAGYRWSRLVSLNEVGCDPDLFGVSPREFHATARRLAADWPATMTTLSTHDTKRQEDVRARLAVLAEMPQEWGRQVGRWHELAVSPRGGRDGGRGGRAGDGGRGGRAGDGGRKNSDVAAAVDPDTEYLMWQTMVGAWPINSERLTGYLTKAIREAKRRTSWVSPDEEYEAAVLGLASRTLDDPQLSGSIARFVAEIAGDAALNSLGAKLVQLTMPGIPDVYQGCEVPALSLVDPDNRREVGIARIRSDLLKLDANADVSRRGDLADGDLDFFRTAKLLVTSRALRLRRARPEWFAGEYEPLAASGPAAGHAVAFRRGGQAITVATRLPVGLRRRGGWRDTVLTLPGGAWADLLTGTVHTGPAVALAELTRRLPVALLVPEPSSLWLLGHYETSRPGQKRRRFRGTFFFGLRGHVWAARSR
jgi:(1->4)-alpha-D-glucan 1-alpha-D-glucosylmutase